MAILGCGDDFSLENLIRQAFFTDNGDGTFTATFGVSSVALGVDAVTPSNTVDLPIPGWFEVRGAAGTVKFDPVKGAAGQTMTFARFELSKMQVKRIYSTGTTATTIVVYYP